MTKRRLAADAEERSFGRGVGGVLILLAAYNVWRGRPTMAAIFGAIGLTLLVLSSAAPAALKWPSRGWWTLAHALGWVNTRLLLTIFFVLVLVPVGVVFRVFGRDLLDRRGHGSSWVPFSTRRDPRHYERMF
jgi:hypothetical protein